MIATTTVRMTEKVGIVSLYGRLLLL